MQGIASSFFSQVDSGAVTLEQAYKLYLENGKEFFKGAKKRLLQIRGSTGDASYCKRTSATADFPVAPLKYSLLQRHYPKSVFFYTQNYDIDTINPYFNSIESEFIRRFIYQGKQVLLSIRISGNPCSHAVAGILKDKTLFIIDTSSTPAFDLNEIEKSINLITQEDIAVVDVNADGSINLQDNEDEVFCVTWMLNALVENGGEDVSVDSLKEYLRRMDNAKKSMPRNEFILGKLSEFKSSYSVGGKRRTIRKICSCSPDVGDCPRCKKSNSQIKMKRKTTKKWIQEVVRNMKKGAFTKAALRHHETPEEYADDVLKHPKKHTLKTRRRAQFLKNIRKTRKSRY